MLRLASEDLDKSYDIISVFSSRRKNEEASFRAKESIKEVSLRLDLHITHAILYFLIHASRDTCTIIRLEEMLSRT